MGASLFGLVALVSPAQAQGQVDKICTRSLDAAEDQYLDAEYDEALRLVAACLNQSDLPQEQAVSAYRMLALIYLKQDELDRARSAVVNLLGIDPNYTADPVSSPPAYVSLVSIVQRDLQGTLAEQQAAQNGEEGQRRKPFFKRTSTWITMSSIVIGSGVATFFALGGGSGGGGEEPVPSGPGSLPIPPGTPTGN